MDKGWCCHHNLGERGGAYYNDNHAEFSLQLTILTPLSWTWNITAMQDDEEHWDYLEEEC